MSNAGMSWPGRSGKGRRRAPSGGPRWHRGRLAQAVIVLALLLATQAIVVVGRARLAGADAVPDCTATATGTPGCGLYVTPPGGSAELAGTDTISPSIISRGTVVTQTATVHLAPRYVQDGNLSYTLGIYSIHIGLFGGALRGSFTGWSADGTPDPGGGGVTFAMPDGSALPAGFTATVTGIVTQVGTSCNTPCMGSSASWTYPSGGLGATGYSESNLVALNGGGPTAAFTATQADPATSPGKYQFVSGSTDGNGLAMIESWNFGDGSPTATGVTTLHTYARPGTYTATLLVTDTGGMTSIITHDLTVAAPQLQTDLSFVDAHGTPLGSVTPKIGDTVFAKLTLDTTNGVGPISHITFGGGAPIVVAPTASAMLGAPSTAVNPPLTLAPASTFTTTYPVTVTAAGLTRLTSSPSGQDAAGRAVTATLGQRSYSVSGLSVTMSVDPADFTMTEDENGTTPEDVTVTETIKNLTDGPLTHVNLRSLEPTRVDQGELMNVVQKSGFEPDPIEGLDLGIALAPAASYTFRAVFTVNDDGKFDFTSLVTAADSDGATLKGLGTTRVEADPKYWLKVRSHVVAPLAGLLPAGQAIVVTGTVTNTSDTATETVAPMYAKVSGNAGLQSFTWNATGADPKALAPADDVTLDPGDSRDFTLRVLTAYSEPVVGASPLTEKPSSGGTRATVTLTPWVTVTKDDGTVFKSDTVDTTGHGKGDILSSDDDLTHQISVDDSIAIPKSDPLAVTDGFLLGTIEGLWNGASGMVTGLVSLPKVSASTLFAITQYQDAVWNSFTPEQKQEFGQSSKQLIASVLYANYQMAKQGLPELEKKAENAVYEYFTALENESKTGNYADVVKKYTSLSTDAIAQVAVPIALGKLAKSSTAVQVLEAAEEATDLKAASVIGSVGDSATVEEAFSSVTKIPSGAQLNPSAVQRLYGITQTELSKLQALADKHNFLVVVRSRAASSIDWIRDFSAMLKPEAIKIKSVSALDVKLGYPAKYEGALIFKDPVPLIQYHNSNGTADLAQLVRTYVQEHGFTAGTADYDNAVARMNDRIKEWNKWSETYQKWADQKWVNTSFNWKGNAMRDPNLAGSGRFNGFKMVEIEQGTYEMQLYNPKTGTYVPITGDIDPIAFTHVDGTPLTREEHAALVNELRQDPDLQAQHGESATYVDGGIAFIASQFKANEAALMIGPGKALPRAVRFNKALSVWKSPVNYHLAWDGGFVSTGANPAVTATLNTSLDLSVVGAVADKVEAIPGNGAPGQPNVGRCAVTYNATATPTFMTQAGTLGAIEGSKVQTSVLENECFTDGPVTQVQVAPATVSPTAIKAGQTEIPIAALDAYGQKTGSDTGFQIGQQVEIDPGAPDAETGTIIDFGSIILAHPVKHDHPAGTVIVTIASAHAAGPTALAATGQPLLPIQIGTGLALVVTGGLALAGTRRRTRSERSQSASQHPAA